MKKYNSYRRFWRRFNWMQHHPPSWHLFLNTCTLCLCHKTSTKRVIKRNCPWPSWTKVRGVFFFFEIFYLRSRTFLLFVHNLCTQFDETFCSRILPFSLPMMMMINDSSFVLFFFFLYFWLHQNTDGDLTFSLLGILDLLFETRWPLYLEFKKFLNQCMLQPCPAYRVANKMESYSTDEWNMTLIFACVCCLLVCCWFVVGLLLLVCCGRK